MAKEDLFGKIGDFLNKSTQSLKDRLTLDVTDLIRAIDKNEQEEVARALNAGVDPNALDGANRLALAMAVDNNSEAIVKLLLDAGAKVSLVDEYGVSPLLKAVGWENKAIVRLLLDAGADIHQPDKTGRTPIMEASDKGYETIRALLEEYHDEGRAKQVKADRAKHEAMKEKARQVKVERLAEEQEREAAALAKKKAAEEKAKARTQKAVKRKYKVTDENTYSAIIEAIRAKDELGAKILLEEALAGDRLDLTQRGRCLLEGIRVESSVVIHELLETEVDALSILDREDHSPLSLAVSKSAYKLVAVLLERNKAVAKDMLNNPDQLITLQFVAYKDPRMLDVLIAAGADPFFGGKEVPAPVIKAIEKGSIGILPVLARHQVDLNRVIEGRQLLEWAIHFNKPDWVIGLVSEGVEIDVPNAEGQLPVELAETLGDREAIVDILRD